MIKPADFDPSKEYPLLLFQYSGPGSQQVANRWGDQRLLWHKMLANQGYIVACVDGRGTGFKGAAFKKVTYLNLVKYESLDQIAAAQYFGNLSFVDKDRIGYGDGVLVVIWQRIVCLQGMMFFQWQLLWHQ